MRTCDPDGIFDEQGVQRMVVRDGKLGEDFPQRQLDIVCKSPDFIIFQVPCPEPVKPQGNSGKNQQEGDSQNQAVFLFIVFHPVFPVFSIDSVLCRHETGL